MADRIGTKGYRRKLPRIVTVGWLTVAIGTKGLAGDFVWPTDASRALSSTFAEYRSGHFHAGIDIKTWGQTGFKVFAVGPGYVWRVRVSPFGYGKVIYQILQEGGIAVYAHLSRFAPHIEERVRSEQWRLLKYSVSLEFSPYEIPVQAGEVIAYTGDTGVGYPHLHFELRDGANRPLNPMLRGFTVADDVPPAIRSLALIPLAPWSRVDGDVRPRFFTPLATGTGRYRIAEVPEVWGPFYVAVLANDATDDAPNVVAPYGLRLYVDGKLIFSSRYDRFAYEETGLIVLDRDYRLTVRTGEPYYRLFVDPGNTLPFYANFRRGAGVLWAGQRLLPGTVGSDSYLDRLVDATVIVPGVHDLTVAVQDFAGNQCSLDFRINAKPPSGRHAASGSISNASGNGSAARLSVEWYEDFARIGVRGWLGPVRVVLDNSEFPLDLETAESGQSFAVWTYLKRDALAGSFVLSSESRVVEQFPFRLHRVGRQAREIRLPEQGLEVEVPGGVGYREFFLGIAQRPELSSGTPRPLLTPVRLFPEEVPLRRPVRISWYVGGSSDLPREKLAWYSWAGSHWAFAGREYDDGPDQISARVAKLGTYAVLADTVPPEIAFLRPSHGRPRLSPRDTILIRMVDRLSGIADEDNFAVEIDGAKVVAEWDPEEQVVRYEPISPLTPGTHRLRVWAQDRCRNRTEKSIVFDVIR